MKNKKVRWVLENFPIIVAGIALFFAISFTTVNALSRYLFSRTFVWTDELVAMGFAYTVFFGSAAACKYGMHYGLELLISLLSLVLICCLAYLAWVLTMNVGTKIMTATRISYRWFDLGMALGLSLMVIYAAENVYHRARALFRKEEAHD